MNPINLAGGWWLAVHSVDDELPRGGAVDRALFPSRYTAMHWLMERVKDTADDLNDYISDFGDDAAEQGDDLSDIEFAVSCLTEARQMLKNFPLSEAEFSVVYRNCAVSLTPVAVAWQPKDESE